MDHTAELHGGSLTVFGDPYSAWWAYLDMEQSAAMAAARTAEQAVKVEKRQRVEAETKLARRARKAQTDSDNKRAPRIAMNQWASDAQVSAAKLRAGHDDKVAAARADLDAASAKVRDDDRIRVDLPDPNVPRSRRLAELAAAGRQIVVQGPDRIALVGPNGVGTTSLLEALVPGTDPTGTGRLLTDRVGYLPQRLDGLDDAASALDISSTDQLVDALRGYRGAVIVVSHDEDFLSRLELTRTLTMTQPGMGVDAR